MYLSVLGIGTVLELLNYQLLGGNNPLIYLRINSVLPLENAIKLGNRYQNLVLKDVQNKHFTSVAMLKYLFTKKLSGSREASILNYTEWFWNTIEDYFMGILPDEVEKIEFNK